MRPLKLLAASTMLLVGITACADDDPETTPRSPDTPGSSPTAPSGTSTGRPSPTAWRAKYSQKEIAAFEDAVARLAAYEREAEPIWANGKYTPDAEELFRRYFTTAPRQVQRLRDFERGNIRVEGMTTVKWSRPVDLEVRDDGAATTLQQCVDESTSKVFQNGERLDSPTTPQLRTVEMTGLRQGAGSLRWYIATIQDGGGRRPCPDRGGRT